jgi:hypothetical protein
MGAGSGLATVLIAEAVPGARVVAVEPSRAMRGILVSRVLSRPDLRARITVLPTDFAGTTWPDQLGGFVAIAMIGQLSADERTALWRTLADRLAPSAPAIVHVQPPARPKRVPRTLSATSRIGDFDYEAWAEAEPTGARSMRWTMTYRVLRDGELADKQRMSSSFNTVSSSDVTDEAAAMGLHATTGRAGLITLRRSEPSRHLGHRSGSGWRCAR